MSIRTTKRVLSPTVPPLMAIVLLLLISCFAAVGQTTEETTVNIERISETIELTGDLYEALERDAGIASLELEIEGVKADVTSEDLWIGPAGVITEHRTDGLIVQSSMETYGPSAKHTVTLTNTADHGLMYFVTFRFMAEGVDGAMVGSEFMDAPVQPRTIGSPAAEHGFDTTTFTQVTSQAVAPSSGLVGTSARFTSRAGSATFDWSDLTSNQMATYEPLTTVSSIDDTMTIEVTVTVPLGPGCSAILDPLYDLANEYNVAMFGEYDLYETGSTMAKGDLNNDGYEDIAFSAPGAVSLDLKSDDAGIVYVVFGKAQSRFEPHMDLAMDADILIYGEDTEDWIGMSLDMGDIDDDGNDDLVIGIPYSDGKDNVERDAGEIVVLWGGGVEVMGSHIDLETQGDLFIYGKDPNDFFGSSIDIEDVDGDGMEDILCGAPGGDGPTNLLMGSGETYLIYGDTRANLGAEKDMSSWMSGYDMFYGVGAGHMTGANVLLGHLDQDTNADILIASLLYDSFRGAIWMFHGSGSIPASQDVDLCDTMILGRNQDDYAAQSMAWGYIDDDSYGDLIIGAPFADGVADADPKSGEVYILWGRTQAAWPDPAPGITNAMDLGTDADMTMYGKDANDRVGMALATGDIDNDGYDETIIGSPYVDAAYNTRDDAGEVYVVRGDTRANLAATRDLWPDANITFYGADEGDVAGAAVAIADMDGDGLADMIIGHPGSDGMYEDMEDAGGVSVRFGGGGMDVVVYGVLNIERSGYGVASGDFDNDGYDDLATAAVGSNGLYGIYGNDRILMSAVYDLQSDAEFSNGASSTGKTFMYGKTMASGDVNNDGYDDVVVGAPSWSTQFFSMAGAIYIYYGGVRGSFGSSPSTITGQPGAMLGSGLAIGNVDSDPAEEIIVGAYKESSEGIVYVKSGGGANKATITGPADRWNIGTSIAVGDIDDDGYGDIIIGAPFAKVSAIPRAGAAIVVKGRASFAGTIDTATDADLTLTGTSKMLYLGYSVASTDLDDDGYDDIVVASPYGDGPWNMRDDCGNIYVKYSSNSVLDGSSSQLTDGSADLTIYGMREGDAAGYTMTTGDINDDGYGDLVIGAPNSDGEVGDVKDCGAVSVLLGDTRSALGSQKDLASSISYYGTDEYDNFGHRVDTGLIDEDAYADIVVGAPYGDGPRNSRGSCGDSFIIYGSDYTPPLLDINGLRLINGDSTISTRSYDDRTCFANRTDYIFRVNVTDIVGLQDFNEVAIQIDPTGLNITYKWERSTGNFWEVAATDPLGCCEITSLPSDMTNDTVDTYTLDFKLNFGYNFPKEQLLAIKVSADTTVGGDIFAIFSNVFRVENDLDIVGGLDVYDEDMVLLEDGAWVRGGEVLTWKNLSVVYEDSTVHPMSGDFAVGVKGPDGIWYTNSTCDPSEICITSMVEMNTSTDALYDVDILNIGGSGQDLSLVNKTLKIDTAGPPAPLLFVCHADSKYDGNTWIDNDQEVFLTWTSITDIGGSGIEGYYAAYNDSTPDETLPNGGAITIDGEGRSFFYVRARDKAGNWGVSAEANITIDMSPVMFANPYPSPDGWANKSLISAGIDIIDQGEGDVDTDSIQYTTSLNGPDNYYSWANAKTNDRGNSVGVKVTVVFNEGSTNYIKWRAQDEAGNGYVESDDFQIRVDTSAPIFKNAAPSQTVWNTESMTVCSITIEDQVSGIDPGSVEYRTSTAGTLNYGAWTGAAANSIGTKAYPEVSVMFDTGSNNYIQWRAKDNAGNLAISGNYRVNVDNDDPMFTLFTPNETAVSSSQTVTCTAVIQDPQGSGVDISTVQYSVSTYDNWLTVGIGKDGYSDWTASGVQFHQTGNYQTVTCTVDVNFADGDYNYIRWRAKDRAGNGYIESGDMQVRTKALEENFAPTPRISSPGHGTSYFLDDIIYFNGSSSDDKNNDVLTYFWFSDLDGPLSNNITFSIVGLTKGTHKITLFVDDGLPKHNASVSVIITIKKETAAGDGSDGGGGSDGGATGPIEDPDDQLTEEPLFDNPLGVDVKDIIIFFILLALMLAIIFNVMAARRAQLAREEELAKQEGRWEQYTKSKSRKKTVQACPNCGTEVIETDEFCPVCGELFDRGELSTEAKQKLSDMETQAPPPPSAEELYAGDMDGPPDDPDDYGDDYGDGFDDYDEYDDDLDDGYNDDFEEDFEDDFEMDDEYADGPEDDFDMDDEEDW